MSFFDQMNLYPRQQQVGVNRAASTGQTGPSTVANAAIEAAKDTGEPEEPTPQIISSIGGTPPPETTFDVDPNAEEKDVKIPGIAKFTGKPAPMTPGEGYDAAIVREVQKRMAKEDLKGELALMVNNDQAMIDAETILQADHEAGMELIGRAQARFKNRTEQLDRELQEYRSKDINPNRIFGNMTGAGRFAAALNVAVGQMASTQSGGANAALALVENAINRDVLAAQNNRQAALSAIQQGRLLRNEEWTQTQEALVERERMRALAYAHIRQRLARQRGQTRTAKAARILEQFETLVRGKEIETRIASRQAHLGLEIDAVLSSGAQAARVNAQLQKIIQTYNQAHGINEAPGGQLSPADIPNYEQGVQGSTQAVMPTEAPSSPVEAGTAPAATTPAQASTARALEQRRQRKQASPVDGGAPESQKPTEPQETVEDRSAQVRAPMTPEQAEEYQKTIEEIRNQPPAPKLTTQEIVQGKLGQGFYLPDNDDRISVKQLGVEGSQEAAQAAREAWLERHEIPDISSEELAEMTPLERGEYIRAKEYSDWIRKYPGVHERYFDNRGTTKGDAYRNGVEVDGLLQVHDAGTRAVLRLTQNSPLRNTHKSKLGTPNDPAEVLREEVKNKAFAIRDAAETADLIEEIGAPGRIAGLEFTITKDEEGGLGELANISIKGLAEEDNDERITKIRMLRQRMVTMAAKFVKAFDQTSRLSDQDMRLAMETLGFSDGDMFMNGILNAFKEGDSAMIEGYANFIRAFGEYQQRDFRDEWAGRGVIFPPETSTRARKELNQSIQKLKDRKNAKAKEAQ